LRRWDCRVEPESVGATLFNAFFAAWTSAVAAARFERDLADLMAGALGGLAACLLADDPDGWFPPDAREAAIRDTFRATLDDLTDRLGAEMDGWSWGRLHTLTLRHVLSGRGELARLLDRGGAGVGGDFVTVFNTGSGPDLESRTGAGYRMLAELGSDPPDLWAADAQSQSGHPGSPHYADQFEDWIRGGYHRIAFGPLAAPQARLLLEPRGGVTARS
jgi:penicillin amidase